MSLCSICGAQITEENPNVLSMGAYANPRYVCGECAALIDTARRSRDCDEIRAALQTLSQYMTEQACDDPYVIEAMDAVATECAERAAAIQEGVYDFALDEQEESYELPEELLETEEDRELDRRDREAEEKMDKFMNWAWVGAAVAFVGYLVWLIFLR